MAKFCTKCGAMYEDSQAQCPRCYPGTRNVNNMAGPGTSGNGRQSAMGQQPRNTQQYGNRQQTVNRQPVNNQQVGNGQQRNGAGAVKQNSAKKKHGTAFLAVALVLFILAGGGWYVATNFVDFGGFKDTKYIQEDLLQKNSLLSSGKLTNLNTKIVSDKKQSREIHKSVIQVAGDANTYHYEAEFETVYCKSRETKGGWYLQDCKQTKGIYSVKEELTAERVTSDMTQKDGEWDDEDSWDDEDVKYYDSLKDVEINTVSSQFDEEAVTRQVYYEDEEDWDTDTENGNVPTEIRAEAKVSAVKQSGCVTVTYDVTAKYLLDVENDIWVYESCEQGNATDYAWDLKGKWTGQDESWGDECSCSVTIYQVDDTSIELEYKCVTIDGYSGEKQVEKSDGKEKASYAIYENYFGSVPCIEITVENSDKTIFVKPSSGDNGEMVWGSESVNVIMTR